jgi:ATP-dependent DNA ligase
MLAVEANLGVASLTSNGYTNSYWRVQEKLDGHRVLVQITNGKIKPLNRNGEPYTRGLPPNVIDAFPLDSMDPKDLWILDGELINKTYWMFDCLMMPGRVNIYDPYIIRREWLEAFHDVGILDKTSVQLVDEDNTINLDKKMQAYAEAGAEGVILRNINKPYACGKRSPDLVKVKYKKRVDCLITAVGIEGKANAAVSLWKNDMTHEIGKVSTVGRPVDIGDIVEVEYLYVGKHGRLYQPVLIRKRTDKSDIDCGWDQLSGGTSL